MAVAYAPTYCSSSLVPKSKLLHSLEDHYGFVSKLSHHGGKNLDCYHNLKNILTLTITKTKTVSLVGLRV